MRASVAAMMARPLPPRKPRKGHMSTPRRAPASPVVVRVRPSPCEALYAAKVCLEDVLGNEWLSEPGTSDFYERVGRICDVIDTVTDALGEGDGTTWRERK